MPRLVLSLLLLVAACASGETGRKVGVTITEGRITPATINVEAGKVTFSVRNAGKEDHELEIFRGDALVDEVEDITPGLTRDLTVDLEAGTYKAVCKEPGHEEAGEVATVVVG